MQSSSLAFILHSTRQGESSRIIKAYSLDLGLISVFAKGLSGRKKNNPAALVFPLSQVEIEFTRKASSDLYFLRKLNPAGPADLMTNPWRSSIAMFMAELVQNAVLEEEPNLQIYETILSWKQALLSTDQWADFPLKFGIALMEPLGIKPNTDEIGNFFDFREGSFTSSRPLHEDFLDGDLSRVWGCYLGMDSVGEKDKLKAKRLLDPLMNYYGIHLEGFKSLRTLGILRETLRA